MLDSFPNSDEPISALGFDYGTQRIGVAFGQSLTGTAQAVCVLKARDGIPDWTQIEALIGEWKPSLFVVGIPYNLDGSESELMVRAIKFANRLNGRFHKPSYGMDERLSSVEAAEQVLEENRGAKKRAAIDDIAAQIILENWFSELAASKNLSSARS
ncbi:MAG: Holliday junction resolvase RuvX [SAR86 cluster bacterium]|uniref:Putative pre-16S rRNA nuclease n=1 Tax=SAR86 cluster bacterium TaxID=2030880 RepID=A0A2A4X3R9_9GAMM|nr:MAG: Holliday junction resolvase RuvX [SAR86 cluster bacterium]